MMDSLSEQVFALMQEAAAREILPRFRLLKEGEIEEKAKGDFVTVADRAAEFWLTPRLEALIAGSRVLGEEAAALEPARMSLLESEAPLWTVDPVDGTANFIAGRETFGVMIGLIEGGEARRGWIYLPVSGDLAFAESGAGAYWRSGGEETRLKAGATIPEEITGGFNVRFMPEDWRARVEDYAAGTGRRATRLCSAWEYTGVARGLLDLVTYYRMMPWDHVPGSLIVREAGGVVRDIGTGRDYAPRVLAGPHLVARDEEGWARASAAIRGTRS